MILSASVNADVPAHYGTWFRRRLEAGYLRVAGADPWKQRRIDLHGASIDGIVFWTRDIAAFMPVLDELRRRGLAFIVHYALTGDSAPHSSAAAIAGMRQLTQQFGPRVVVWRYDPVLLDERHSSESHSEAFAALARTLTAVVDEVVVAFAQPRASRRMRAAGVAAAVDSDGSVLRRELVRELVPIARECGMRLSVCSDAEALAPGSSPARCVDARRLAEVSGRTIDALTAGFMRDCLCARAVDIGDYGGAHPVCFCGAEPRRKLRLRHDPESEFLFEPAKPFTSTRLGDLPF